MDENLKNFVGVDFGKEGSDKSIGVTTCQYCGTYREVRMEKDWIIEECPKCGDGEIDIASLLHVT
jgi:predicted RNA-binding Zn-ribbon protein involved in translation (DUF1610 family)